MSEKLSEDDLPFNNSDDNLVWLLGRYEALEAERDALIKHFSERENWLQGDIEKLRTRLARADGLLLDNYPCYDENKCKNCVGDFSEIDYRTCIGYNVLKALRGRGLNNGL